MKLLADFELNAGEKVVQKLTKEGLVSENLATGEQQQAHTNNSQNTNFEFKEDVRTAATEAFDRMHQRSYYNHKEKAYDYEKQTKSESSGVQDAPRDEFFRYGYERPLGESESGKMGKYSYQEGKAENKYTMNKDKAANLKNRLPYKRKLKFKEVEKGGLFKNKTGETLTLGQAKITKTRLRFEKHQETEKNYQKALKKRKKLGRRGRLIAGKVYNKAFSGADELDRDVASYSKRAVSGADRIRRNAAGKLKKYYNPHAKIQRAETNMRLQTQKSQRLREKKDYLDVKQRVNSYKDPVKRKQMKKQMRKARAAKEGNRIQRANRNLKRSKDAVANTIRTVKSFFSVIGSVGILLLLVVILIYIVMLLILMITDGGAQIVANSVIQTDYYNASDATAYLRKLETELEESLLEENILESYPDCYEYIFELGEIGHDPLVLLSYLGAKYGQVRFEDIKNEILSIFEEMYTVTIKIVQEERECILLDANGDPVLDEDGNPATEIFIANICYIKLEVIPLEDIVEARLEEEQKNIYGGYLLSSGGQQIYSPVMTVDWTNLITSRFGERIHPVTDERTFHNGVDIGVPTGTPIYSATKGKVLIATYSETAGNFIHIQNEESGWIVIYMHLDSLGVSVGDKVEPGDFIGRSGNTGRSTGPHLHLEIRDKNNIALDPTFIVPSTYSKTEE